ncbi:tRNA (cytosine(38)-C(5))-methyltransferase [Dendroctonus ponderosae]|uniref:DNA methyltransferase 2 n=1 Tax=Dendroctonus ponderosae TaxID=77166 RepID=U4UJY9_DENPD|nr:tRNA (cytosine(38)-C(5))-methyltransferase [Dendroctonus ponderosae]XP_019762020.2 tRNA (cytosine(38)-C(5))-methyltransferase [Dendroctonus ponderosae]XP_048519720.1 tRNA (cytosine(38)-C(5))-methyltransferase [Dendroctonus ponderosae]ERL93422.1 hypothetical protein D910_10714 [Dendroctonus ponderosae]KAH1025441.1 hypothetical protein HUJ05_010169 [Dendroctonus ponderosae]
MQVLELYSGIGGMHMAFKESGKPGCIKAAVEINTTANSIYKYNFPDTKLLNLNIEGLTADTINQLEVDTILMSPPCQPFTRNGKQLDMEDARSDSFQHILHLLPDLAIKNVLIENVKGFEQSEMRNLLIKTLTENSFTYQEFLLTPYQFGIPNSRLRYYCLAKKRPEKFQFETRESVMDIIPSHTNESSCFPIQDILEDDLEDCNFRLHDSTLKRRLKVLDICYRTSRKSCCFTKAYGRFMQGTGSVFTDLDEETVFETLANLGRMDPASNDYLDLAQSLNLRFFTPHEIAKLMGFPETFSFPQDISNRQKYMVLGNSINVKVVSKLIRQL